MLYGVHYRATMRRFGCRPVFSSNSRRILFLRNIATNSASRIEGVSMRYILTAFYCFILGSLSLSGCSGGGQDGRDREVSADAGPTTDGNQPSSTDAEPITGGNLTSCEPICGRINEANCDGTKSLIDCPAYCISMGSVTRQMNCEQAWSDTLRCMGALSNLCDDEVCSEPIRICADIFCTDNPTSELCN